MELSAEVHDLLQRFRTLSKPYQGGKVDSVVKSSTSYEMQPSRMKDELLNLDDINFDNDEYWLYGTPSASAGSVQNWLYSNHYDARFTDSNAFPSQQLDSFNNPSDNSLSAKKIFDSRTYTRPKKKFIRPSIDRYRDDLVEQPTIIKSMDKSDVTTPSKPLHFDLTQPMTCSRIFDNIAKNAPDNDSFQNMSPPSLINSMCSSTFTAAMDSSIIRNDPVLREIRTADYKAEPLMLQSLQSLTESYSSINSDSAENYLRRTLPQLLSAKNDSSECDENFYSLTGSHAPLDDKLDDTLDDDLTDNLNDRNLEEYYYDSTKIALNNNTANMKDLDASRNSTKRINSTIINSQTKSFPIDALTGDNKLDYEVITNRYSNEYLKSDDSNDSFARDASNEMNFSNSSNEQSAHQSRKEILDATFNKSKEIACDTTFNKSFSPNISNNSNESPNRSIVNGTFTRSKKNSALCSNATFNANDTFEKNRLDTGDYYNTNELVINGTFRKDKDRSKTRVIDTNTLRNLTYPKYGHGSGDSLDRLSNYSDSSKGSVGKMTMAEVDAIVERQEQSLSMSTPKPAKSMSKLFDSRAVLPSPIHQAMQFSKEHVSDSELSEEYSTARSSISKNKRLSMHFDTKTTNPALNTTTNLNRTYKSMSNLKQPSAIGRTIGSLAAVKQTPSTANYATYRKPSATVTSARVPSAIGNVTSYARSGSERNVPRAIGISAGISQQGVSAASTNLRTMGSQLKASYTSLRPSFANLPHAPVATGQTALRSESATAIGASGTDQSYVRQSVPLKSASSQSVPAVNSNNTIIKQRGLSALPRPVSGIPKPTTSKIPGPRPFRPSTAKPLTNLSYSSNTIR